jgi:hypothetical protein
MSSALLKMGVDFCQGLRRRGTVILNYTGEPNPCIGKDYQLYVIDATSIAVVWIGYVYSPIVNCVMLGSVGATSWFQ